MIDIEWGTENCVEDTVSIDMSSNDFLSIPFTFSIDYNACAPSIADDILQVMNAWILGMTHGISEEMPVLIPDMQLLSAEFGGNTTNDWGYVERMSEDLAHSLMQMIPVPTDNLMSIPSGVDEGLTFIQELFSSLILYLVSNSPDNKYCAYLVLGDNSNLFFGSLFTELCIEANE